MIINQLTKYLLITLVYFSLFEPYYSWGQDRPLASTYEVQLIPASPEVATFGKYGDVPVNKYNGSANVTVPIHEILFDGLLIPIALQYNTSGIRVNQDASSIGLGWNLSPNISITREVNGFEDILPDRGWIFSKDYLEPKAPVFSPELDGEEFEELQNSWRFAPVDTEPDLYRVSLPTGSVKFILKKQIDSENKIRATVLNGKNYQIYYDIEGNYFSVKSPDGFFYKFDNREYSTGYSSWDASPSNLTEEGALVGIPNWATSQTRKMTSTWKITRISSPYGRSLEMSYDEGFFLSYPSYTERYLMYNGRGDDNTESSGINEPVGSPLMSASFNAFHVSYLTRISGDFGEVSFVLEDRHDLLSPAEFSRLANKTWEPAVTPNEFIAKKVSSVVLKAPDGSEVKRATLHHSYFNSQWEENIDQVSYIRLKLDKVSIEEKTYNFNYHKPDQLPRKDSKSTDFWGFYNGKENRVRIPSGNRFVLRYSILSSSRYTFEQFRKWRGADRSADIQYGKVGILEEVIYPTGGKSIFSYEGHQTTLEIPTYRPSVFQENNDFRFSKVNSSKDYNFRYQYLKSSKDPDYTFYEQNSCGRVPSYYRSSGRIFTVEESNDCNANSYSVRITATLSCQTGCGSTYKPTGKAVWLINQATDEEINVFNYTNQFNGGKNNVNLEAFRTLEAGTYKIYTKNWTKNSPTVVYTASPEVRVWHNAIPKTGEEEFEIGGARVKKITHYDQKDDFVRANSYSYDLADGRPSGLLMDDLIFSSTNNNNFEYSPEQYGDETPIISSVNTQRGNPSALGGHIGYSRVKEQTENQFGNHLGWTICTYLNSPNEYQTRDIGYSQVNVGLAPGGGTTGYHVFYGETYLLSALPISHEYDNGKILTRKVYDQAGYIVSESENEYQTIGNGNNITYPTIIHTGSRLADNYPYKEIILNSFDHHLLSLLSKNTTTEYYEDDRGKIEVNINYTYGRFHNQVVETSTIDSEGKVRMSTNYYPQDIDGDTMIDKLKEENRFQTIVRKEFFEGTEAEPNQTLLYREDTFFSDDLSDFGAVMPSNIVTRNGTDTTDYTRVVYERYNDQGKLLQYRRQEDGLPVVILWSYNGEYPVAKIENAEFYQVVGALRLPEVEVEELPVIKLSSLQFLRDRLPNSMVYTYTIKPLVGITSVEDPNGIVVDYQYDKNNRLEKVVDHQGNILQQFEYKYSNQ